MLTIFVERYAAIRERVKQRRVEALAAEITATDWSQQPHFQGVNDFVKHLDTLVEQSKIDPPRPRKHQP
jgi:hypothetical protein